jgi:hypothetical protein
MADAYFATVVSGRRNSQGFLPAVLKCCKIAAENLKYIIDSYEGGDACRSLLLSTLDFALEVKKEIQSDPVGYDVSHEYMA